MAGSGDMVVILAGLGAAAESSEALSGVLEVFGINGPTEERKWNMLTFSMHGIGVLCYTLFD